MAVEEMGGHTLCTKLKVKGDVYGSMDPNTGIILGFFKWVIMLRIYPGT